MTSINGIATEFINFTRASNATVTDSNGLIKWAPHNLLLASEQFDASQWSRSGIGSVSANSTAAPNGTTTADTLVEDTSATAAHHIVQTPAVAAGQAITYGLWVKRGSGTRNIAITIIASGGSDYISQVYDLGTGALGSSTTAGTGVITGQTITAGTSGWYFITLTGTASTTAAITGGACRIAMTNGTTFGSQTYTGDGTSSVILWGAHVYNASLGGMQANTSAYPMYNPTTPKNLLGYTERFESQDTIVAGAWTYASITVAANSVTGPNGLQTADLITATSTGSGISQVFASVANRTYTLSVYAKAGTITSFDMGGTNQGVANYWARFDLTAVTATNISGGTTPSIVAVGNGWYRCSLQKTVTAGNSNDVFSIFIGNRAATVSGNAIYLWGAQLSDSASLDSYSPVYGAAVTSAAYYGPRRDFDPVTLACKGLLVEEQRTNLLLHTAAFDVSATWIPSAAGTGINAVVTANDAVAPDGTTTADKVVFDRGVGNTITDRSLLYQNITVTASSTYTASFWIKAATAGDVGKVLAYRSVAGSTYSTVTLTASWQRLTLTEVAALASSTIEFTSRGTVTSSNSVGVHLWGAQLELGSFATSYIPVGSTTAGATRSADVAQVSTAAFPYSATEGTYVANFQTLYSGAADISRWIVGADASTTKRIIYIQNTLQTASTDDGATTVTATGDVTGYISKVASTYAASGRTISSNGGAVASGTIAAGYAATNSIDLATRSTNNALCGWLRQFTYIPRKLTDTELQSRTA